MRPPYGRVHHQLHAAGLVEEPFEDEAVERGHRAEHRAADGEVVDQHRRGFGPDARSVHEPGPRAVGVAAGEELVDPLAERRDLGRQLVGARRRLAHPERNRRRGVAGVAHADHARLDAADLPRVRAEQEDVARHRLDRPVLVDGADEGVVGLGDDAIVAVLGNRAARGERREPCALAPAHLAVDRVVVHVRAASAAAGLDAAGHELDDFVELGALELGERRRPCRMSV